MRTLCTILIILILVSCTPRLIAEPDPTQIPLTSSPSEEIQPIFTPTQGDIPNMTPDLQNLIEKAKEDLAQRLSISVTEINLVEAMEVEWSDSSLDCPKPGMEYLQVITPGYRILLESGGSLYEYHSNRDAYFVYCENVIPPISPPKP